MTFTQSNKCLSCHIIGLNPYSKKELINNLNPKIFNLIDLDTINQQILGDPQLDKMFKQYQKLKNDKNDKFKEIDKKMSNFWETNFIKNIEDQINTNKNNILIGQNSHYKSISKRINIECTNKFIITSDIDNEVQAWIKYNLENYSDAIVKGNFPLEYINYDFLSKKRVAIENTYKKIGYIEKTIDQVQTILKLIEDSAKIKGQKIWVSLKEPYNVNSLIHPIKGKIIGYTEPNIALLESLNLDENIKKSFNGNEIKLVVNKNQKGLGKLKTRRFLYLVENKTFIPDEDGNNQKFFSQTPIKILAKEKIDSVYDYLIGDSI
jgi:hypothetical protein